MTAKTTDYVQSIEMRFQGQTALIHCAAGDQYFANLEDGKWWLQFEIGQPTEGPFADLDAVTHWLNEDE